MDVLHITNGDSTVDIMRKADIGGEIVPWRDVLHDGPVPGGHSLDELSRIRAGFIAGNGWGDPQRVREGFEQRDAFLKRFRDYRKVVLWFEQDLYDQLQLIQILAWLAGRDRAHTPIELIQTDNYLGWHSVEEMAALVGTEVPVSEPQFSLAEKAWNAFCADEPTAWQALLELDTSELPYLAASVARLLEEYPSAENGLTRTQTQALRLIEGGEDRPGRLFEAYQQTEQYRFMGDLSFWDQLNELISAATPLLATAKPELLASPPDREQRLSITKAGMAVLRGKHRWVDMHEIDRWVGGVHLTAEHLWCWDEELRKIMPSVSAPEASG